MTKNITFELAGSTLNATTERPLAGVGYGFGYVKLEDGKEIYLPSFSDFGVAEVVPEIELPTEANTIFTYTGIQTGRKHVYIVGTDGNLTNLVTGNVQPPRKVLRWVRAGSDFAIVGA